MRTARAGPVAIKPMWMRLVTSFGASPALRRKAIETYREHDLPTLEASEGFYGLALGDDADRGSILSVSFWRDEAAMLRADRLSTQARHRVVRLLDADKPIIVEHHEVKYAEGLEGLASPHVGGHMLSVRFASLTYATLKIATETAHDDAAELRRVPGFDGLVIAPNRRADTLTVVSFWHSRKMMLQAERLSRDVTDRTAAAARARREPVVDRIELLVASHLDRLARGD